MLLFPTRTFVNVIFVLKQNAVMFLTMMIDKIDSPHGREVYLKRMGIVEPVFANIRTHKRLEHFTLRGQKKVNVHARYVSE